MQLPGVLYELLPWFYLALALLVFLALGGSPIALVSGLMLAAAGILVISERARHRKLERRRARARIMNRD
ncbi:MAG: hypothetical protein R3202_07580 [Candidatus Competibacterales bacterium]|nr:hypothetical protein [Candidatus Competibacterales bacterium]